MPNLLRTMHLKPENSPCCRASHQARNMCSSKPNLHEQKCLEEFIPSLIRLIPNSLNGFQNGGCCFGFGKRNKQQTMLTVPNAAMTERDHGALSEVGQGGWPTNLDGGHWARRGGPKDGRARAENAHVWWRTGQNKSIKEW